MWKVVKSLSEVGNMLLKVVQRCWKLARGRQQCFLKGEGTCSEVVERCEKVLRLVQRLLNVVKML